EHIFQLIKESPRRTFKNVLKGLVPERFLSFILERNNISDQQNAGNISNAVIHRLCDEMKKFTFTVSGSLPIEKAFVTGGGVSINEIIPNTMQSKIPERLFFCGEILDIHGY